MPQHCKNQSRSIIGKQVGLRGGVQLILGQKQVKAHNLLYLDQCVTCVGPNLKDLPEHTFGFRSDLLWFSRVVQGCPHKACAATILHSSFMHSQSRSNGSTSSMTLTFWPRTIAVISRHVTRRQIGQSFLLVWYTNAIGSQCNQGLRIEPGVSWHVKCYSLKRVCDTFLEQVPWCITVGVWFMTVCLVNGQANATAQPLSKTIPLCIPWSLNWSCHRTDLSFFVRS